MSDAWMWAILLGLVAAAVWHLFRPSETEKESKRYRRDIYRQQQASWHAQEESWSRPVLDGVHIRPLKPRIYRSYSNIFMQPRWYCGLPDDDAWGGNTPKEAFDAWAERVK